MSDLATRLESWASFVSSGYECPAAGSSMTEAAALIRDLQQQLKTAREEERERCAKVVDNLKAHLNFEQFLMILRDKTQASVIVKAVIAILEANAAAIRSLGEK